MFNKDYSIKGKYADYMRTLIPSSESQNSKKSAKVFDYGYQVLFLAPLIGVAYDLGLEVDETDNMDFTVKAIQMIRNKDRFEEIYRMVLLAERSLKLSPDERVDYVFRPSDDEKEKADELFNAYTRGGIEWLYNNIAKGSGTEEDYLNKIIDVITEFTSEFGICRDMAGKVSEMEELYF